jgi:hypothetical protein
LPLADRFITFGGASYNAGRLFVLDDGVTKTGPYLWDPSRAGADMVGGLDGSQVDPAALPEVSGGRMWMNRNTIAVNCSGTQRPGSFINGTRLTSSSRAWSRCSSARGLKRAVICFATASRA